MSQTGLIKHIDMSKAAKVLVTVVIFFVFSLLFGAIVESSKSGRPGFIGLILFAGLIGGIRAIWKTPKQANESDKNDSILQK